MLRKLLVSGCAILLALLALSSQRVSAEVDGSAPDLSMFKLRKVNAKEEARKRVSQPIADLATGALHLRESLFADDQQLACATYAHLFNILKGPAGANNKVRQDTVESLALVVVWDKEFYVDLFAKEAASEPSLGDHFLEAAQKLESMTAQRARDTWAQLYDCMSKYLAPKNEQVIEYLSNPGRGNEAASVNKFNAVPVLGTESVPQSKIKAPANGLVHHLAKKIDGEGPAGRRLYGRLITDEAYKRSRGVVEAVEPDGVLLARRQFGEKPAESPSAAESGSGAAGSLELNRLAQKPEKVSKFNRKDEPREVDLVVINQAESDAEPDKFFSSFNEAQLAVLEYVRMRLDGQPADGSVRPHLSMQLALDFLSHWEDLEQARIDPTTEFGRRAIGFLEAEQSQQVARRVQLAIGQYVKLISLLAEMKMQESSLKSLDPLQAYLERLTQLLNTMDGAFDVDDVRRMHAIWKAKYVEYRAMERFINSPAFNF